MNKKIICKLLAILAVCAWSVAQAQPTQTMRGKVVDKESKYPLIGVNIRLQNSDKLVAAVTDERGNYRLAGVPVGRQAIKVSYIGYKEILLDNIIFNSGKETILNVEMEESGIELQGVQISATRNGEAVNEMASVSAREFSVEQTDRYAGSRGEPARMASNFAGVQGADDSRNDIVIRGNTPQGLLYRLEGVNIPNPNHFAIPGTSGGPVTILNNKFLGNSDFFTGAFPAEFGNGIAGVFDLKMRNGNNEKHEFGGQFGLFGTDLIAEGPINKKTKSSYLAMYRYSNFTLFKNLGLNLGTTAVPKYQDGAFRLNFPLKNEAYLSFFGIGGESHTAILISKQLAAERNIFGSNDRDQYFASNMGVLGASYTKAIDKNTYFKTVVSASKTVVAANHDKIFFKNDALGNEIIGSDGRFVLDSLRPILDYTFDEKKYSATAFVNKKISAKTTLKYGTFLDINQLQYNDSARIVDGVNLQISPWRTRWNAQKTAFLAQPYIQLKHKLTENLTLNAGVTALYYSLNSNSFSPFEPRVALTYQLADGSKFDVGVGRHSQIQSNYAYFYEYAKGKNNQQMGLTKSNHIVAGYNRMLTPKLRMKTEIYYQSLSKIPVKVYPSSFSMVNAGSGFSRIFPDTNLVNTGTGRNYGAEFTLERFFSNGYFYMLSVSVFDAKYKGSDGVLRNTDYNGRYALNLLATKEFTINKKSRFSVGGKVTSVGGRWYGAVDTVASARALEVIFVDNNRNTQQFKPYFRTDIRLNYIINAKKRGITHEIAIDLVNVLNTQNILTLTYAPSKVPGASAIREDYQLGFLPVFYYKIEF